MTGADRGAEQESESGGTARLISASAVMAAGTGLSRIAGFVRALLLVAVLGGGTRQADMFTIANTVPNMLYILLAGGVLNTVFVPQVVRAMKKDADGGEAYTNRLLTVGLLGLLVITVAVTAAAPLIIWVYTSGGWKAPALAGQYESMIFLAYLCLPQVFFYGVNVLLGQVLNARGRFGPMMFSPIANNLVSIGVLVAYLLVWPQERNGAPFGTDQVLLLGLGSTAGILVQAAVLVPFLRSAGFHYRPRFDFLHTGLRHTAGLAKWTLAYVVVTQLAVVVVTRIASSATVDNQGAGVLVYSNAYLLWILPHSLITVSLATAMLPSASAHAAAGDLRAVAAETTRTMRLAVTALLPAAVAFIVLAQPIVQLLFGNGRGARDAPLVGFALVALAVGLVPFTLQYICLRAFYALEDTRTPFFIQLVIATANIVFAIVLTVPVGRPEFTAAGLGLAYSLAYVIGLFRSLSLLGTRLPQLDPAGIARHCVRTLVAVLPAAVAAYLISWGVTRSLPGKAGLVLSLVGAGVAAVVLFGVMARLLHIAEVDQIIATVTRRGRAGPAAADESGHNSGRHAEGSGGSASPSASGSPTIDPAVGELGAAGEGRVDAPTQLLVKAGAEEVPGMTDVAESAVDTTTTPGPYEQTRRDTPAPARPTDPHPRDIETVIRPPAAPRQPAGTVLVGRYRLEEILAFSEPTVTWRAFDLTLSRSVLVHLLPADHEQAPGLLSAARTAAAATDSRFLRVLDAVDGGVARAENRFDPSERSEANSYIVCEYATGQSLQTLLVGGPLSGLEAAWICREAADAIAGVHAAGLHHGRLSPDTVVITPAGNVKIVGLLIEQAMRPPSSHGPSATGPDGGSEPHDVDVLDLGRLLYAMLVGRWPGGPAYGLPDTPGGEQGWATPRQVRAGVSPALDRLADQVLSRPPRHHADPILTAAELTAALSRTLGPADASADLERRLRQPVPKVTGTEGRSRGSARTVAAAGTPTTVTRTVETAPRARRTATSRPTPGPGAPISRPPATPESGAPVPRGPRRWVMVLALLIVLAAVAVMGIALGTGGFPGPARGLVGQPRTASQAPPTAASEPPAGPVRVVSARDFDPEGRDGSGGVSREENPEDVAKAIDGDLGTAWRTVTYLGSPELGNLKDGVGLVLDLGEPRVVTDVDLQLTGQPTSLSVEVPRANPATTTRPALNSVRRWTTVGTASGAGRKITISLQRPVTTRFVLVYLTSLPREGNGYRGGIAEVEVR